MAEPLNLLIDVLNQQSSIYKDLLEISEKKLKLIEANDVVELEKFTKVEQTLILRNSRLEKQREELAIKVREEYGLKDATFSSIEQITDGVRKERLLNVRQELEQTISRLRDNNEICEKLIRSKLDFVDFMLNLYTGQNGSGNVYAKDGQAPTMQQKINLFDKKA